MDNVSLDMKMNAGAVKKLQRRFENNEAISSRIECKADFNYQKKRDSVAFKLSGLNANWRCRSLDPNFGGI